MKAALQYLRQKEDTRQDHQKLWCNPWVIQALRIAVLEERKRQKAATKKKNAKTPP